MRVLFLHGVFPGTFRLPAHALGMQPENTVLFLSEAGRKLSLPGVRRLRVSPPQPHESDDPAEQEVVSRIRRAAKTGNAMLRLRKDGFIPDLICASSSSGGCFYVRDIFPQALYLVQADWFYTKGENHCFFNQGRSRPAADFAPARVRNLWEYNAIGDCDLAVISSAWQKAQYPDFLAQRFHVLHSGIDVDFFSPKPNERYQDANLDLSGVEEIVSFSGPIHDGARGFTQFAAAIEELLRLRPACHVLVAWPEQSPHKSRMPQATEARLCEEEKLRRCRESLPLSENARKRVHLLGASPVQEYRRMLRASTVHVYLTAPHALSTGILEAMACGALVVGSDTAPVREVLEHGVNGFLCDFWDSASIAEVAAGALALAPRMSGIRQAARERVLHNYHAGIQTERLLRLVGEHLPAAAECVV